MGRGQAALHLVHEQVWAGYDQADQGAQVRAVERGGQQQEAPPGQQAQDGYGNHSWKLFCA